MMMIQSILSNMAIIFLLHLCVESLMKNKHNLPKYMIQIGMVAFISISVIALFYLPIHFNGYQFDLRMIPLIFLTLRWGYPLAIPALLITTSWRLLMGGVGAVPGVIFGMILPVLTIFIFRSMRKTRIIKPKSLFFLITLCWLISDAPAISIIPNGWEAFLVMALFRYPSLLLTAFVLCFFINQSVKEAVLRDQLKFYAERDPLTGLYNIRSFIEKVEVNPFPEENKYIVMADIDHFKDINDSFGHINGDEILKKLASILKQTAAQIEGANIIIGRYGGEEFIFYLSTNSRNICSIVEMFHQAVARTTFHIKPTACSKIHKQTISLTISMGVARITDVQQLHHAIDLADHCLYQSKQNGRNQIHYTENIH